MLPHRDLFWRSGYSKAFRRDEWKLYVNEKNKISLLFNLVQDPAEKYDRSKTQPGKLKELQDALKDWEQKMRCLHYGLALHKPKIVFDALFNYSL